MMIAQQLYEGIELPGEGARSVSSPTCAPTRRASRDQALDRGARVHRRERSAPTTCRRSRTLQDEEGRRAGRARGDPADVDASTTPTRSRAHLTPDQYYLYRLIWNRFVASQMPPATFDETTVDIDRGDYLFRVKGSVPKFAGWMAVYNQGACRARRERRRRAESDAPEAEDDEPSSGVLPPLAEGDARLLELEAEQKFTQPPPRYSEATLVKALEENGIGRPSTYASIIASSRRATT